MRASLLLGDCFDVMREMDDCSVHAVVTDPPYGFGFMGKAWDVGVPPIEVWAECLRVLKPGGHLLAFGGPRTYHRLACAVEDAGFEIRDQIMWLFGSGFPKSHNLNGEWDGWGTALKPAHEPIVVARKSLVGTVAANVLAHGTGALNIGACRVDAGEGRPLREADYKPTDNAAYQGRMDGSLAGGSRAAGQTSQGRWPANVIHDGSDEVVAAFPEAKGQQGALTGDEPSGKMGRANCYGLMDRRHEAEPRGDAGSAARFFYCPKASRADRNEGCEQLPDRQGGMVSNTSGQHITRRDGGAPGATKNNHPTVKPTDLMRYLCRLVTPPGGIVLDPFMGSGSTGKAAALEGFGFIGIELDPDYMAIAEARIAHVTRQQRLFA